MHDPDDKIISLSRQPNPLAATDRRDGYRDCSLRSLIGNMLASGIRMLSEMPGCGFAFVLVNIFPIQRAQSLIETMEALWVSGNRNSA